MSGPDEVSCHGAECGHGPFACLLTLPELARMLRVGRSTAFVLESEERLPKPILIGRRKRWACDEIGAWIRAGAPPRSAWDRLQAESCRSLDPKNPSGGVRS